jgi:molecular chaperone DnaK (HSP70)
MFISATDTNTGKSNQITIKNNKGRISDEEIERMITEAKMYEEQDKELKDNIEARISFELYLTTIKKKVEEQNFRLIMGDDIHQVVSEKISDIYNWLYDNDKCKRNEYLCIRNEIEDYLSKYIIQYDNKINEMNKEVNKQKDY